MDNIISRVPFLSRHSLRNFPLRTILIRVLIALPIVTLLTLYLLQSEGRYAVAAILITSLLIACCIGLFNVRMSPASQEVDELEYALSRLERKYEKQQHKRAREQDRLDTVIQTMNDGVIMLNRNGKVRLINAAALEILECTEMDVRRKRFSRVAHDPNMIDVWEDCFQNNHNEVTMLETSSRDGSQEQLLRMVVTTYLHREDRGYLIILQDLTRLHHLQTVRRDFVSNVSHELRTPLASLKALVETLHDSALDDPPAARHFLQRMEVEVDTLTGMVHELLELSRIESGEMSLALESLSSVHTLHHAAERLAPQANRAQVTLTTNIPADLPKMLADSGRIQQVVTNLVHNAIKFTPPDGKVTVSATVRHHNFAQNDPGTEDPQNIEYNDMENRGVGDRANPDQPENVTENATESVANIAPVATSGMASEMIIVHVTDTGVGIPARDLPRIFERFYKTDRARAGGGTGLGLAICKHIVQAHNGQIWAESIEGQGSTFSFSLPVA